MKIFLDVGHGGVDSGAVSGGLVEKHMTLVTAEAATEFLRTYGVTVKLSRTWDKFLPLTERCEMANAWKADYFVSCHYNAGGGDRGEVIHSIHYDKGIHLARAIGEHIVKLGQTQMKLYSRTSTQSKNKDYYTVINGTNMPAVIVEPCFIDNVEDRKLADTPEEQREIGIAIAKGILDFLEIPYETEEQEMIYNYIDKNMPEWARPTIQKLVDKGYLKGNENGELGLTDIMLRLFVVHDRAGFYDK